jgi:hypothetical protein
MSVRVLVANLYERKRKPWLRPPEGVTKYNVVAAYDADQGKGCMGAIARISWEVHVVKNSILWRTHSWPRLML